MKFLRLLWGNLMRRKLRTLLTLLSIFVAFLLFGLLCTIKEAFSAGVTMAGADRLIVRHKVSLIMLLPVAYERRIANVPGVDVAMHWTWFNGIYQNEPKNFFGTFPVEPDKFLDIYPEYTLTSAERQAWMTTRTGAIVGRTLAERFGWKVGDHIPITSPLFPRKGEEAWEFEIVGIYQGAKANTDTSNFFFRYDYFDEARASGEGMVGWYVVRVKDPNRTTEVAKAIGAAFAGGARLGADQRRVFHLDGDLLPRDGHDRLEPGDDGVRDGIDLRDQGTGQAVRQDPPEIGTQRSNGLRRRQKADSRHRYGIETLPWFV